jgi:hypothetical protein
VAARSREREWRKKKKRIEKEEWRKKGGQRYIKDNGASLVGALVMLQGTKEADALPVHLGHSTRAPRLMTPL